LYQVVINQLFAAPHDVISTITLTVIAEPVKTASSSGIRVRSARY
jgi:hypothetical protein